MMYSVYEEQAPYFVVFQVGDFVDAQDTALKWYEAIVKEVTPETVKVHYFGWGSRWDGELPRRKGVGNKVSSFYVLSCCDGLS